MYDNNRTDFFIYPNVKKLYMSTAGTIVVEFPMKYVSFSDNFMEGQLISSEDWRRSFYNDPPQKLQMKWSNCDLDLIGIVRRITPDAITLMMRGHFKIKVKNYTEGEHIAHVVQ